MSIPLPNLDDRTVKDLFDDALSSLDADGGDWTDRHPSDTGIVLLELLAGLSEMLLYQAERVSDRHYESFLELLNEPGWEREGDLQTAIAQTISELRRRHRAVTPEDFEFLTLNEWPVTEEAKDLNSVEPIVRVKCFHDRDLTAFHTSDRDRIEPGHISTVVVPKTRFEPYRVFSLDGKSDCICLNWHEPETAIVREIWFKTRSPDCGLLCVAADNFSHGDLYLEGGSLKARLWREETISTSRVNFADDRWHCLVHQWGNTVNGQELYVDGIWIASGQKTRSDFYWNDRLFIGYSPQAKQPYFCGQIARVRIWKIPPSGEKELLVCCQWDDPTAEFLRESAPTMVRSPSVPMQIVSPSNNGKSPLRIGVDTLLERGHFLATNPATTVQTLGYPQCVAAVSTPYPSAILQQKLWTFLDDRRLLTVRHHVVGPEYVTVKLRATLQLKLSAHPATIRGESVRRICQFFDPLTGGENGQGWEWGRSLRTAELYPILESIPGVDRATQIYFPEDRDRDEVRLKLYQLPAIEVGEESIETIVPQELETERDYV